MITLVQVIDDKISLIESSWYEVDEWRGFTLRDKSNNKIYFDLHYDALKWVSENIKQKNISANLKEELIKANLYDFSNKSQKYFKTLNK